MAQKHAGGLILMLGTDMDLTEYVYALFDHVDFTFVEGVFQIRVEGRDHQLASETVIQASRSSISKFPDLQTFFLSLESDALVPSDPYILVREKAFSQFIESQKAAPELRERIDSLTRQRYALTLAIPHSTELEPMDYIRSVRDRSGIERILTLFLSVVRAFQDYHIVTQAPHIYVPDVHCGNAQGIFSYFVKTDGPFATNAVAISDYYRPKLPDDAADRARAFFRDGGAARIEDLLKAKAEVYAERQNLTFAIIHAVMALEVVVPDFVNDVLRAHGVNKSAVDNFDGKFGISVRVKAMLKLILPPEHHATLDKAAEAISYRNKIMHEGWTDTKLPQSTTGDLVKACSEVVAVIKKYRSEMFPTTASTATNQPALRTD